MPPRSQTGDQGATIDANTSVRFDRHTPITQLACTKNGTNFFAAFVVSPSSLPTVNSPTYLGSGAQVERAADVLVAGERPTTVRRRAQPDVGAEVRAVARLQEPDVVVHDGDDTIGVHGDGGEERGALHAAAHLQDLAPRLPAVGRAGEQDLVATATGVAALVRPHHVQRAGVRVDGDVRRQPEVHRLTCHRVLDRHDVDHVDQPRPLQVLPPSGDTTSRATIPRLASNSVHTR